MTPRACPSCRWSRGVDCERPDALPAAWLAANEVAGVLVPGADGCPGWEEQPPPRERCVAIVVAEPGLTTAEVADRAGIEFNTGLRASLRRWGLTSELLYGRRPGVTGSGAGGRILRWYPRETA